MLQVNRDIAAAPIAVGALIHSCSAIGNMLLRNIRGDSAVIGSLALGSSKVQSTGSVAPASARSAVLHRQQHASGAHDCHFTFSSPEPSRGFHVVSTEIAAH